MCPIIFGSLELCRLNRIVYKIVFTLIKKFHNKVFKCYLSITPSVALLSYLSSVQFSRCNLRAFIPSKLNNARIRKGLT